VQVLGVEVATVNRAELLRLVATFVAEGQKRTVAYANVHVLNTAYTNKDLKDFLNRADLCFCDGEGVRKAANWLAAKPVIAERMTGADWIWDLSALAEKKGWRLFWLGGEPGVTAEAAKTLRKKHPGLKVQCDHGFYKKSGPENEALIERINAATPDIVLVGMGTPEQERWVAANRERLEAPVVWVLGATADFISGKVSRGPAFLYNNAEWVARLITEPRRLWRRYLVGNVVFMGRVGREKFKKSL
jgi:N-acetylglucosaminyldiphosphoundecaprenol N-acetyl-beta-D-mannosaminyltransferase